MARLAFSWRDEFNHFDPSSTRVDSCIQTLLSIGDVCWSFFAGHFLRMKKSLAGIRTDAIDLSIHEMKPLHLYQYVVYHSSIIVVS